MSSLLARRLVTGAALLFVLTAPAVAETVRIVVDGPWDRNEAILGLFQEEMEALLADRYDVSFGPGSVIEADWTPAGVAAAVDAALTDPEVDVVVGLGVLVSNELAHRPTLPKPVVAPFVLDPEKQGVPISGDASGVRNLSYITSVGRIEMDLHRFREVVPFEKLAFLATSVFLDAIPALRDQFVRQAEALGVEATVHAIEGSAVEALAAIPGDADAVYVAPLLRLPDAEFDALVAGFIERGLPSFSLFGRSEVERGILLGNAPQTNLSRRARRTALYVQRILSGEDAGTLPVHFPEAERLSINLSTARAVGVRPSWAVLTDADVIERERRDPGRRFTFHETVNEATRVSADLAAVAAGVQAGRHSVGRSRSNLLPQVEASALGTWIDDETAATGFGPAERQLSASLSLSQAIVSDPAWTGLSVERRQQLRRELDFEAQRLDVARNAANAYLNVLRAQTAERIQGENLERTLANLELARVRERVGASGPGETYRWEGEVANGRRAVIDANSARNVAEIEFNRLLRRPLEEPFRLESENLLAEAGLGDPRLASFLADPASFRIFRDFLEDEAVRKSPELAALDEAIGQQETVLGSAGRAFWLPDVGLQGEVSRVLGRDGEGEDAPVIGPVTIPRNDTTWNVGLRASLPLFEGGGRVSERRRAAETVRQLELQRDATEERIRQRLRSALHLAGASWAGIDLSRQAADAAGRNLELVRDAYSQGVVSVLELLDAQNAALVAQEGSENAVFDFLIDLNEVQRALGAFFCWLEPEELDGFLRRLETFRDSSEETR